MTENKEKKRFNYTVAISTRNAPPSIIRTIDTILNSALITKPREFIVITDGFSDRTIKKELIKRKIRVIENRKPHSLASKFKKIVKIVSSDILVFTQDDILFTPFALFQILKSFKKEENITLISSKVEIIKSRNIFEQALASGMEISNRIGVDWRRGDNYLLASGRCMAFRTSFIKKLPIPDSIVNFDAFLYFLNKKNGGRFKFVEKSVVLIKGASNINDHMSQSSRFQNSSLELQNYFDLEGEYQIPLVKKVKATCIELIKNPIPVITFNAIYIYSRLMKLSFRRSIDPFWKIDISTKKL